MISPAQKRFRSGLLAACICALHPFSSAFAQNGSSSAAPFDMSPEGGAMTAPAAPLPSISIPAIEGGGTTASDNNIRPWRRYIIPFDLLTLQGEADRHSWTINLTAEEASAPAQLNLGYQSAILVAPETSSFTVSLNNVELVKQAIRATGDLGELHIDVPQGLLRSGANALTISVQQRHRTDCTIESTYELWTNIDPAKSYLTFDLPSDASIRKHGLLTKEDIQAIGVNEKGSTHFNLVAPGAGSGDSGISLLKLSQALALMSNMPNQIFAIEKTLHPTLIHQDGVRSGELTVLIGTDTQLASAFNDLRIAPSEADAGPIRFVSNQETGERFLLIGGINAREVEQNIQHLVAQAEGAGDGQRTTIHTRNWQLPNAKILYDATSLPFAELGVNTQQFSGRRLREQFTIGIPADFYAEAYGSVTILLDAAYSPEVLPGSHIDIYVNGDIATTVPITNEGGGVMKQLPIKVTMNHFRPGLNTISLEAVLMTDADKSCIVGGISSNTPRFALFDTSKFVMPSFARLDQAPDLSATAGMGYPYATSANETTVFADMNDTNVLSAAANVMARLAVSSGHPLKLKSGDTREDLRNGHALFIDAISHMDPAILTQAGIDPQSRSTWSGDDVDDNIERNHSFTLNDWQAQLQTGWYARLQGFFQRMGDAFNLSGSGFILSPDSDSSFNPPLATSLVTAQGMDPDKERVWTVVTAKDTVGLRKSVEMLVREANWRRLDGRLSAFDDNAQAAEVVPATKVTYMALHSLSFENLRLVATNWFSKNGLFYVIAVVTALVLLGLSTSALLAHSGRREDEE